MKRGSIPEKIRKFSGNEIVLRNVDLYVEPGNVTSDDIVFMDKDEIVESGPPDQILCNHAEVRTAKFVSSNGA